MQSRCIIGFSLGKNTHRHVSAGKTTAALVSERRQHLDEGFIHKIYMQFMYAVYCYAYLLIGYQEYCVLSVTVQRRSSFFLHFKGKQICNTQACNKESVHIRYTSLAGPNIAQAAVIPTATLQYVKSSASAAVSKNNRNTTVKYHCHSMTHCWRGPRGVVNLQWLRRWSVGRCIAYAS